MKKQLLLLFSALLPLLTSAQTRVEIEGIWYNLIPKVKQAEVTFGNSKYSGSINIPSTVTYEGVMYAVTNIGDDAFAYSSNLTSVTIPKGVTNIGDNAFNNCYNLTSITIPEGVTNIGEWAFSSCRSLIPITIPQSATSIGKGAFSSCSNLTSINIPASVTSIGIHAFSGCSGLTTITVADGNTTYDSRNGCNAIIQTSSNRLITGCSTTVIPLGVMSIGNAAFYGSGLTSITIPTGVMSIEEAAFENCSNLTSIIISEGVTMIGNEAFQGCFNLTNITIPKSVTYIGQSAFSVCRNLTNITIPESVTHIGESAFYWCNSLTAITIPNGVTSIESQTFSGCSNLTTITAPSSITNIGYEAFFDCKNLTTVTIPDSVTNIGKGAFSDCRSLTSVVLPKNLRVVGLEAFANCPELLDVYCYTESVPYAESNAFESSFPEYATLHVPNSAVASYKTTTPWSGFGTIVKLGAAITKITLDKTSATLTEGEVLTLTITTTPDDTDMNLISWSSNNPNVATVDNKGKVTAIAPGTATITATANDGSGVSSSCKVTVNELILGKCHTPSISYVNGEVVLVCDTKDAIIKSEIKESASGKFEETRVSLIPTYTITAYATKTQYEDSDVATLTICWIPCTEEHYKEETGILTIPSKPVLISARDGVLTLSGLAEGTAVTLYTTDGNMVAQQQSCAGEAQFTVDTNQVYLVHIDDKVVKIGM